MAKSIIKNILGIRSFNFALPADENASKIFADRFLEGQYEIYKPILKSENEVGSQIWDVTVTGKNIEGCKTTFSFYLKGDMDEGHVKEMLCGKTFNNVKFDTVYIINMECISLG
ncbi:MAG: hypothetical protein ACTTJF_02100 [Campylobacter sp.]|jgi:hypothetical protein|uniref:hypothetical protein n=1 Tax=Campylobacter sp. TaxID=205 RepID=UPI003FA05C02